MGNKTSQPILSTSANLLGFCLFIITALHLTNESETVLVDEFTSIIAIFLIISSALSFISIRTSDSKKELLFEEFADYFFLFHYWGFFIVVIVILVNFSGSYFF